MGGGGIFGCLTPYNTLLVFNDFESGNFEFVSLFNLGMKEKKCKRWEEEAFLDA